MWQSFVDGKNKLCVSNEILEEYIEILQRLTDNETAEYVVKTILNSPFVELITPFYHFNLITVDPDDNKFVDCAISAKSVLPLSILSSWQSIFHAGKWVASMSR